MPDVEIYIKNAKVDNVIAWIKQKLDRVRVDRDDAIEMIFIEGFYEGLSLYFTSKACKPRQQHQIFITIQGSNSDRISVWFRGKIIPWTSHLECAKDAYQYLKIPIICDPGKEYPYPGDFMLIDENGERIVDVDEDEEK